MQCAASFLAPGKASSAAADDAPAPVPVACTERPGHKAARHRHVAADGSEVTWTNRDSGAMTNWLDRHRPEVVAVQPQQRPPMTDPYRTLFAQMRQTVGDPASTQTGCFDADPAYTAVFAEPVAPTEPAPKPVGKVTAADSAAESSAESEPLWPRCNAEASTGDLSGSDTHHGDTPGDGHTSGHTELAGAR